MNDAIEKETLTTESDYDSFDTPTKESSISPEKIDASKGIIDREEEKKKMRSKEDVGKTSFFIKWFEKYLNSIYSSFYKTEGTVEIKHGVDGGHVNLESLKIVLFDKLINDLWASKVPPLLVFYHEIGHVLYTTEELSIYGKSLSETNFNLLNWIEDFYIEDRLMKELYFIKPYIKMLHEVVPDFIDDWQKPHFAFHYYYCYEGMTPRWMDKEPLSIGIEFKQYIEQLKHLRASFSNRFAREKFIRKFEDFYMFCVKHRILTKETPPPPMDPSGKGAGEPIGTSKGPGGRYTGDSSESGGTFTGPETEGTSEDITGETYKDDEGEDVSESKIIHPPFKPLHPKKGFDPVFADLLSGLEKEFEKTMFDSFKLAKKGKPELVPLTIATTSPRSMVDPIAIETCRSDIYLEYTTEDFAYTAYNLFIDVSGSVGHNLTFNTIGKKIIDIIRHYPYAVYGYGNDVIKWNQEKIDNILKLTCRDGTESPIIGDIILEKKELGNLNIILSDGDLSNLCRRKDISEITKQYLFVFIVASGVDYHGYATKYLEPNQWFLINTEADFPKGLEKLKSYIASKGL